MGSSPSVGKAQGRRLLWPALPGGYVKGEPQCDEGERRGAVTLSSALRGMLPYSDEAPSPAQKHSVAPYCLQTKAQSPLSAAKALTLWLPPASPASVPPPALLGPKTQATETCCFPRLSIGCTLSLCFRRLPSPRALPSSSLRICQPHTLPKVDCHSPIKHGWLTVFSVPQALSRQDMKEVGPFTPHFPHLPWNLAPELIVWSGMWLRLN